nr:uncharacterized protein LOC110568079 [Aotus nancymaae]
MKGDVPERERASPKGDFAGGISFQNPPSGNKVYFRPGLMHPPESPASCKKQCQDVARAYMHLLHSDLPSPLKVNPGSSSLDSGGAEKTSGQPIRPLRASAPSSFGRQTIGWFHPPPRPWSTLCSNVSSC